MAAFLQSLADMNEPTIDQFMTSSPHTIAHHQTLATAHGMMRRYSIRHLPVLEAGKLAGIVSQRDLHLLETLKDIDPETVTVGEAMTQDVFTIEAGTSVKLVASEMAAHKYGCAVVVEREQVIGVFTTVDALKALVTLVDR